MSTNAPGGVGGPGNVSGTANPIPFRPLYGAPVFNDTVWFRNQLQTKLQQLIGNQVDVKKWLAEDKGEDKKLDKAVSKDLAAAIRSMRTAIKEMGGAIDPTQPIPVPIINGAAPNPATLNIADVKPPPNISAANIAILNAPIPTDNEVQEKLALKGQLTALVQAVRSEAVEIGDPKQNFTIGTQDKKHVQTALNHVATDLSKATDSMPAAAPRTP
jgi:hypothetical protein